MTSISTPTPMNETIRVTLPLPDRSTSEQLDDDGGEQRRARDPRQPRRARAPRATSATSAIAVQSRVMPVCTASESSQASTWYGTPP